MTKCICIDCNLHSFMIDSFDNLPHTTQRRIDKAFDAIASSASPEPRNGVPVYQEDTAGGFLLDAEPGPGLSNPSHIPFSLVPDALCRLNLPTDDDQILSVFRNAASMVWSLGMIGGRYVQCSSSMRMIKRKEEAATVQFMRTLTLTDPRAVITCPTVGSPMTITKKKAQPLDLVVHVLAAQVPGWAPARSIH